MGTITLVRHGQANSAATDEAGYDRLSDLGQTQSTWLGDWLRASEERFDTVLCGTLNRHRQTAAKMGYETAASDARLNEMDYFNLSDALHKTHGIPRPDGEGFAEHIPVLMEAWHRAEIMGNETFAQFETRVSDVLQEAAQPGKHVLCITSGGVIAMAIRHLLDLDPRRMAHITLPIHNTSLHRVHVTAAGPILAGFNATPHLEASDRLFARTHF